MPLIEGAMSITGKGRELIRNVEHYLNDKYQARIVYGDSVSGDTPILCRHPDGRLEYISIRDIGTDWYRDFDSDKEYSETHLSVWSDMGWTKIKKVMRHFTNKAMVRVMTNTGCVDVTIDHSLLTPQG